jgi:hypothetical protein
VVLGQKNGKSTSRRMGERNINWFSSRVYELCYRTCLDRLECSETKLDETNRAHSLRMQEMLLLFEQSYIWHCSQEEVRCCHNLHPSRQQEYKDRWVYWYES